MNTSLDIIIDTTSEDLDTNYGHNTHLEKR